MTYEVKRLGYKLVYSVTLVYIIFHMCIVLFEFLFSNFSTMH